MTDNKIIYDKPWARQKALQQKYVEDEVPSIPELVKLLANVWYGKAWPKRQTKQARALFAIYYLTACRATEILYTPYLRKRSKKLPKDKNAWDVCKIIDKKNPDENGNPIEYYEYKVNHPFQGISKADIRFKDIDGHKCMVLRTENRKNKNRKTKNPPIPLDFESDIAWFVRDYLEILEDDSILFSFGRRRAEKIIEDISGFNIHFIRHIRATHLVSLYDFNEQALVKYMGWTDSRPARHYMELKSSDIVRQFYKNKITENLGQPTEKHDMTGLPIERREKEK
jgi:integrase